MRRGLLLLLALPRAAGNAYNSSAYAPLDGVVGDRLAQMVGFPSLAALAGPQDLMTSGEVALLVSGNLMLLEALAPHLLWLRRGPLFTDDASAGSAALGASRLPGAGFRRWSVSSRTRPTVHPLVRKGEGRGGCDSILGESKSGANRQTQVEELR